VPSGRGMPTPIPSGRSGLVAVNVSVIAPVASCSNDLEADPFAVKLDAKVKVVAAVEVAAVGVPPPAQPAAASASHAQKMKRRTWVMDA
jgi:hypothetical protein